MKVRPQRDQINVREADAEIVNCKLSIFNYIYGGLYYGS